MQGGDGHRAADSGAVATAQDYLVALRCLLDIEGDIAAGKSSAKEHAAAIQRADDAFRAWEAHCQAQDMKP